MGLKTLMYACVFLLGFLSFYFINLAFAIEQPFGFSSDNVSAPKETISRENIQVFEDKIVISIEDASLGKYAPSGSMIPLLDENSKGIRIKPESEDDINVGDIISYRKGNELIIHRVIEKGTDEFGTYFILKGDNNFSDDGKVRFSRLEFKTIGMIW